MLCRRGFLFCFSSLIWAVAIAQPANLDLSAIEASALRELGATKTPGTAIGIVQNGRLTYAKGFGTSNIETGDPITANTLFRLGSTTKMLTASAVASLAAEGKLDFSDPVGKHISGLDPAIGALTVNQILSHTSGLKDEAVMNGRHDDAALGEEIRRWMSDWLFTAPGAIYSYANPGFWLAGYVAECVAGKPYADVMDELIFRPLGMTSTTLRPVMAMTRRLSQGHEVVNGKPAVLRPAPDNAANWPAGSVFSNLADLSRFAIAMMNDGKLDGKPALSPKAIAALTTPHAEIPGSHSKYGYGLTLDDSGAVRIWAHGGSRAGYGSFIAMIPARQEALIVLANRTGESLGSTRGKILSMLGAPPLPPNNAAGGRIAPGDFSKYIGSYRNGGTTWQIAERDGKLYLRGQELRTTSEGGLVLWSAEGKAAGHVFPVAGANGKIEYLHMGGRSAARVP